MFLFIIHKTQTFFFDFLVERMTTRKSENNFLLTCAYAVKVHYILRIIFLEIKKKFRENSGFFFPLNSKYSHTVHVPYLRECLQF